LLGIVFLLFFILFLWCLINLNLLFGIHGDNEHFGTPTNPAAWGSSNWRICSSGSAVAVAGGMVDFALGELIFVSFLFKKDVSLLTLLITTGCFIIP
jgi:hypothetical protein